MYNGPLSEGVVQVQLELEDNENLNGESLPDSLSHEGFLTMFNDVSGYGAWHRRWFRLRNGILSFWKYPEHAEDDSKVLLMKNTKKMSTFLLIEILVLDTSRYNRFKSMYY